MLTGCEGGRLRLTGDRLWLRLPGVGDSGCRESLARLPGVGDFGGREPVDLRLGVGDSGGRGGVESALDRREKLFRRCSLPAARSIASSELAGRRTVSTMLWAR